MVERNMRSFARHPFYVDRNAGLIDMITALPYASVVYEFGSGEGAVTELILDRTETTTRVYGIEPSAAQIKAAEKRLKGRGDRFIQLIRAKAEDAGQFLEGKADVAIMCNCIHLIKDKLAVIRSIFNLVEDEGQIAINTAFYEPSDATNGWPRFEGCQPLDSLRFYRRWMSKALRALVRQGLKPRKEERSQARNQLTASEYLDLVEAAGFRVLILSEETADITLDGWQDISKYELFAQGTFPGVPVKAASEALQNTVQETLDELGLLFVPRNWLSIVAEKAS